MINDGISTQSSRSPARQFAADQQSWCILLADDNPVVREAVASRLRAQGCAVVAVGSGKEALDALDGAAFDIVLMDVQMPGIDGIAAAEAIRSREAATGAHIPIVAMTAHAEAGERERCLAAGMNACVVKPIRTEALLSTIHGALSGCESVPSDDSAKAADGSVVNRTDLVNLVDGDLDLLARMIGLFRAEYPKLLADLRAALANRDYQSVQRSAHAIKGMMSNFGAKAATGFAGQLEAVGRADGAGAARTLGILEGEIRRLDGELRAVEEGGRHVDPDHRR